MQIKTMRYYYIPIRKAKIWTLAPTNIAENMEQQALWFTAGENIKWYSHFEDSFIFLQT